MLDRHAGLRGLLVEGFAVHRGFLRLLCRACAEAVNDVLKCRFGDVVIARHGERKVTILRT
jgi:hypothetical protein